MANKRSIKKRINYLCSTLFAECVASKHYNGVSHDDVDNVMLNILQMHDDLLCRVSHLEPGMSAALFFKKLSDDIKSRTEEIVEQLTALV